MPPRDWTVEPADAGTRLDKWLAAEDRVGSRARALEALSRGRVFLDGREQGVDDAGRRLEAGQRVRLWLDRPGSAGRKGPRRSGDLDIVFEDDLLLVVNKPPGLLAVPVAARPDETSVADLIATHWRSHRLREPLVVHRIDRDTSGLVVFAKDGAAWKTLKTQFLRREPERIYRAVVEGVPSPASGTWRDYLQWSPGAMRTEQAARRSAHAREAITHYTVDETFAAAALMTFRLESGRRHQIRVQAWLHGHPLVGERMYRHEGTEPAIAFPRQALHATRLGFVHPKTGRPVKFEAPLPSDFRKLLASLRRGGTV
jgi:23S rRNA pseudouridine1911/1915/1917 synthase